MSLYETSYLKETIDYEITYRTANELEEFIDTDWASDSKTRRSLGVYVFLLYNETVS